jgi:ATP phosphoribosyltransferase
MSARRGPARPRKGSTGRRRKVSDGSVHESPVIPQGSDGRSLAPRRLLSIALPAGRIRDEAIALFAEAGIDLSAADRAHAGRRLVIAIPDEGLRVLIVRDTDVPAYVEGGAADLGIAGRDVLEEQDRDLYEPLDLGIGRCRLAVAEPQDRPVDEAAHIHLRYATKFPEITRRHLQARGTVAEVIKLYGSVEIAPLVGLADRIVDLVSSGETLRQHRLREVETILEVSARLCVGRAAAKLMAGPIDDLVARLGRAVGARAR